MSDWEHFETGYKSAATHARSRIEELEDEVARLIALKDDLAERWARAHERVEKAEAEVARLDKLDAEWSKQNSALLRREQALIKEVARLKEVYEWRCKEAAKTEAEVARLKTELKRWEEYDDDHRQELRAEVARLRATLRKIWDVALTSPYQVLELARAELAKGGGDEPTSNT